jgi:DNA gyrase inhibitor GyrI
MSRTEMPRYTTIESHGAIEIRDYEPMIVAETRVTGERRDAINQGFRSIAGYIFGGNRARQKIAMTAPVTQQPDGDGWRVRFVMPSAHTLDTLPLPDDPAVRLGALPAGRYAAIRFSGTPTEGLLARHRQQLLDDLAQRGLPAAGEPIMAFYNPPWTLPFLRRNEILVLLAG